MIARGPAAAAPTGARLRLFVGLTAVWAGAPLAGPTTLVGQTPTMPSTLRYGSGLLDVPVSSVLPHLNVTATYSGFFSQIGRRVEIDDRGLPSGYGPGRDRFYSDASFAVGLLDRAEAGVSLQSLGNSAEGGAIWGLFGRVRLWEPIDQGVGLAVGARYVDGPSFGDGREYAPSRLGIADERLRTSYTGVDVRGVDTDLSLYAVATAYLRGFDGGPLPENDISLTLGYGGGMFSSGGDLGFYGPGASNGWFFGSAVHVDTGDRSQLAVMAEHNGFDVNVGAQYDWDGFRVGAHWLATNHTWPASGHESEYLKPKFGLLASVSICPRERGLRCRPRAMRRVEPDTVYLPPPPPDTVVIQPAVAEIPEVEGEPGSICLSTGQNVPILVTAAGDTLVGPAHVRLADARPALGFAGAYAASSFWYQDGRVIVFEGGDFGPADEPFPMDCDQILRVGIHQGIPVFAVISAQRPLQVIFIPVSPGSWRRYIRGYRGGALQP